MTLEVTVPTKIVIMGTSSMSLNERFSHIKQVAPAKQVVRPSRKSLLSGSRRNLAPTNGDYADDEVDEEMMEEEVFDPTYATLRRTQNPVIQRQRVQAVYRPLSLQERVSFSPQQQHYTAPYTNNHNTGYGYQTNRGRAGFRGGLNRMQNGGFRYNPNYGRLNNPNGGFQLRRYQNNGGFPPRYNTGRGRFGARMVQKKQPKHTSEELDRELDAYMKKPAASKHTPITME